MDEHASNDTRSCYRAAADLFSEDGRQRLLWFTPALDTTAIEEQVD